MTFWLRRWYEQSRRPTAHAVPLAVGDDLHLDVARRRDELLEQHGAVAERLLGLGLRAVERGRRAHRASSTRRMPRPPPPAVALIISGKPMRAAWRSASSTVSTGPPLHGATGTPASSASRLAAILSPTRRMTAASGPTKTMPSRSHSSANSGLLGDEAPPDPHRVGARLAQRALQRRRGRGSRRSGRPPRRRGGRTSRRARPRCRGR